MRKIAFFLAIALLVSIPLSVHAAESRTVFIPRLSFSGTTANCSVDVDGDTIYDYIVVTMKLFQGNNLLKQWSASGSRSVSMSESYKVTKGVSYTLTIEVMINGTSRPSSSVTKTC